MQKFKWMYIKLISFQTYCLLVYELINWLWTKLEKDKHDFHNMGVSVF